jgi:NADH dehydrogenase
MSEAGREQRRVVILGAGFGGLAVARGLARVPVDITLIDRTNHNLFQPLLYQVATAALAPSDIAVPIRSLFRDEPQVAIRMDEVVGVDTARRHVRTQDGAAIPYDVLVVATGSVYSWFGHDEWATHSHALKTLDEALKLRGSLLAAFELAESRTNPDEIARLMTFVIVGGGPTGVELAGALAELAHSTLKRDFAQIDPKSTRIVLCEAGPTLLAGFPKRLTDYAAGELTRLGVEVRTGVPVEAVDREGVVAGGQRIPTANVLWCAGTAATPAAGWLGVAAARNGFIPIGPDCSVPGLDQVFAIGDVTIMQQDGRRLPGVAPVAKQQGAYVAKVIAARVAGAPPPGPFRYHDEGQLAIVGRSAAVADFGRLKLTGLLAWLLWSAVHLFFLIGARNRLAVYLNWAWAWLTYGRGARLITRLDSRTWAELLDRAVNPKP